MKLRRKDRRKRTWTLWMKMENRTGHVGGALWVFLCKVVVLKVVEVEVLFQLMVLVIFFAWKCMDSLL